MSNTLNLSVTEQFRPEFENRWQTEYQQTVSRTAGLYESYPVTGEYREFPLLQKTDSVRKLTKRFEETSPTDIATGKRRVTTTPHLSPLIFDRKDQKKFGTLESPIPGSIANQRAETYRNQDEIVVGKADEVGGLIGLAIEVGQDGVVSYPSFDSNYVIPANYKWGGTIATDPNVGMSIDKLQLLKMKLGKLAVISQDNSTNNSSPFGLLIGYSQVLDLINDGKLNHRDQATALLEQVAAGKIVDVLGFSVRALDDEHLPISNNVRTCIAFAKNAVAFGYNEMPNHEMDVLPTKTHALQSVFYFDWGMGRIWDQGVFKVQCLEA